MKRGLLTGIVVFLMACGLGSAGADYPPLIEAVPAAAITELDPSSLEGQVVYLDFWASWCVPCRHSFPWMNEMQRRYQDQGLVIVAVNVDKDRDLARQFLENYPADFQVIFDPEAGLAQAYGISGMPYSFVIGRDGVVRESHAGFRVKDVDDYEASLRQALDD